MSQARSKLIECFSAVFPLLSESEIVSATHNGTYTWDSVATVTLVAVVEEEFGLLFAAEEIEHLTSFEKFLKRVQPAGPPS